ncbi:WD repeat-containing protein [Purpureocillium lilacinum]|uniref:Mitochondrial division protein 1 n=1 Tax=Purpureocillium lilacinum TaxID=33203 RepID=A0A179HNS6_PURLI|nr:WD repeat-containing protein [Purpureocillium lilacinum]OAQ91003.1 WD repeat-containing protein [Purpureocillium lilacinum]
MDIDSRDERAAATPPLKRRRADDDTSRRSGSPDGDAPRRGHPIIRRRSSTDNEATNGNEYPSSRQRPSRSPSPSRSRSRRRSRSRSSSSSRTRSESAPQSRTRSHSRRRSPSPSTSDRTRSESYSPRPRQAPTPPHEPLRPDYRPRLVLHGHTKPVSQVRISPNGRFIASASADATLKIWDAATGAHMDTLVGHMAGVSCLAWTPDSNTLASGSDDKAIRLWDRVTGRPKTTTRKSRAGQEIAALRGHHNYIHCLAFSPKGNILASGSYDEAVFLWDVRAGRLMRSLPAHSDPVSGIDFCRDGTLVVSCSTDGLIRVWDTSTGQCLRTLVHEDNPAVTNVCFSPNGRFVLAFNLDNCIRLWDYVAGTVKKTYQGHRNEKFAIGGCFAVLDGEPFIASASEDGDIVLWDVKSKDILQRVPGHKGICFWVDVHGETMVSAGQDNTVRVYRHRGNSNGTNGVVDASKAGSEKLLGELPIRQEDVKAENA